MTQGAALLSLSRHPAIDTAGCCPFKKAEKRIIRRSGLAGSLGCGPLKRRFITQAGGLAGCGPSESRLRNLPV